MFTILFALATVAVDPAAKPAAPAATATPATATATAAGERKYCIKEALTGSRMERRVCRTKQEWQREGVDVGN